MVVTVRGKSFNVSDLPEYLSFWKSVQSGMWESETFEIFEKYLRPDKSYLDIGAWIGPTALFGCQLAKMCYAFEPDPVAFQEISNNRAFNPEIKNLFLYQTAVGIMDGMTIGLGAHSSFGDSMASILNSKDQISVNQVSLAKVMEQIGADVNFIKMDIEGGEGLVLPVAKAMLQAKAPILYLSLHAPFWPAGPEDYFNRIIDVISVYQNIYFEGQKIQPSDIKKLPNFDAIVCTND